MTKRIWAALLLITLGLPARAEVDCRVVNALSRIHAAEDQLADPSTLEALRGELLRHDGQNVAAALAGHPNARDREILSRFAGLTARLARIADQGDGVALRMALSDPATIRIFEQTSAVLGRFGCTGPAAQRAAASAGPSTGGASDPVTEDGLAVARSTAITPETLLLVGFLSLMAVAGLIWGIMMLRRHNERRRRRSRRYSLNRPIHYLVDGERYLGRILDISCVGMKLQHSGQIQSTRPKRLQVVVSGLTVDGRTTWINAHYAGIEFVPRIRFSRVLSTLSGLMMPPEPSDTRAQTKTAPRGAPSANR